MEDLEGQTVKGYKLQERIGAGGFGAVYRALQSTVGREVAIKIILPGYTNHPDFIRRFEAEAQLVARLEHLHIAPLYDYWRDPEGAYLVMRYLRGGNLTHALRQAPYDLESAALLLDQISSALSLAHSNNIIHRDIKPENILLDEDGNAYLADFGIAKDVELPEQGMTDADSIVGSPDYIAPEQARKEPVSARSDIYSLGVVLYEMLAGQHPFPDLTPVERLFKHLNEPLPAITTFEPDISEPVNNVIQKATAKDPEKRYSNVRSFASVFRTAAGLSVSQAGRSLVELLTPREQEVLKLMIDGKSNREIAEELVIEVGTVKWYSQQIYRKLNVRSRVQAIVKARELNLIVDDRDLETLSTASLLALPEPENPYKGLQAFQVADERYFFGRESLTKELLHKLEEDGEYSRFLSVVGPSGSGKSSLVKAGLIPALWRGELPGSERWFVVDLVPGPHPLDELEVALMRIAAQQSGSLMDQLERDERGLVRVAKLILPDDDSELVIVIDQFEELFTLVEDEEERAQTLHLIRNAVTDPRSRVRIVATLRADYYDRPLQYPEFGALVQQRTQTVLPLTAEELERAILRPAEAVGVDFEEGLAASIAQEVHYQPGALPLMQYALTELFEEREDHKLTHSAYEKIGGSVGALAKRIEGIFGEMDSLGQESVRQLFLRLVTLGEGVEDTRRRVPRSELLAVSAYPDVMDELIDTYTANRLLSLDHDPATRSPTVELAHEAILREWERLRGWLDEGRSDIRLQRALASAGREWQVAEKDGSYLLRGLRLIQYEQWAEETELALTAKEREFLRASLALRDQEASEEAARQDREAKLEGRARRVLQALAGMLLVAAIVSGGFAISANSSRRQAEREAEVNRSLALAFQAREEYSAGHTDLALQLALEAVEINDPPDASVQALADVAQSPGASATFDWYEDGEWSTSIDFSPGGRYLVSGSNKGTLFLQDLVRDEELWRIQAGEITWDAVPPFGYGDGLWVGFSSDGNLIATSEQNAQDILPDSVKMWDAATGKLIHDLPGLGTPNAFSPDGRWFLTAERVVEGTHTSESPESGSDIVIWDLDSGREVRRLVGSDAQVWSLAFSPGGAQIISGGQSPIVRIWSAETGDQIQSINTGESSVNNLIYLSEDTVEMVGTIDRFLLDIESGSMISATTVTTTVRGNSTTPYGRYSAYSSLLSSQWFIWDNEAWQSRLTIASVPYGVFPTWTAFAPDENSVMVSYTDGTVRLWDLRNPSLIETFGDGVMAQTMRISPDGTKIATGHLTGDAVIWDALSGKELVRIPAADYLITDVAFSPDGEMLAVSGHDFYGDGTRTFLSVWDAESGNLITELDAGEHLHRDDPDYDGLAYGVWGLSFSPAGDYLFSSSAMIFCCPEKAGKLIQWDVSTWEVANILDDGSAGDVYMRLGFIEGDQTIVTTSPYTSVVKTWDFTTGELKDSYVASENSGMHDLVILPDERRIISPSSFGGPMFLRDLRTGKILNTYVGHHGPIWDAAASPDGTRVIAGDSEGNVLVWDVETGDLLQQFSEPEGAIWGVAYSLDGRTAFSVGEDGFVRQWRVAPLSLDDLLEWVNENREF